MAGDPRIARIRHRGRAAGPSGRRAGRSDGAAGRPGAPGRPGAATRACGPGCSGGANGDSCPGSGSPGDDRLRPESPTRRTTSRRLASGDSVCRRLLRSPGRHLGHRTPDLRVLHPAQDQPAVPGHLASLRTEHRTDPPRRLQAAAGDQLPRQPLRRTRARLHLPERHGREGRRLPDGRARAHQDRPGLRGQQEGRDLEDRRSPQSQHGGNPPRYASSTRGSSARSRASSAT